MLSAREQYTLAYRLVRLIDHAPYKFLHDERDWSFWYSTPEITDAIKGKARHSYILSFKRPCGMPRGIYKQARRAYVLRLYTHRTGKFPGKLTFYGRVSLDEQTGFEDGSSLAAGWEY